jgi:hypothetical protein
VRLLALFLTLAGCRYSGTFQCDTNDQCGASGTCQPSRYCSFMDPSCASGQKYDETAGPLAGQCVGEEQQTDAGVDVMPDAPFDLTTCPATYSVRIASSPSHYRLVTAQATFWEHTTACASAKPGATHLVIPESVEEIVELSEYIDPISNTGAVFYVGVVQDSSVTTPAEGWIRFDGQPVDPALWLAGEPDDFDGTETDRYSQVAGFDKSPQNERMDDLPGVNDLGTVCECDGKSITPAVQAFVDADPRNPN